MSKHSEFANDLRALADFIESHPEFPAPKFASATSEGPANATSVLQSAGDKPVTLSHFYGAHWQVVIEISPSCYWRIEVDTATLQGHDPRPQEYGYRLPSLASVGGAA